MTLVLTSTVVASPDDTAREITEKGLDYLATQQQDDGSWQPSEQVPPAVTALVARAFAGNEAYGPDDDVVKKGFDALVRQQGEAGDISNFSLANYNTAISVSALAAANTPAGDNRYGEAIDKGVAFLRTLQWTPETARDFPGGEVDKAKEGGSFYGGWGYGGGEGATRPDLGNTAMALEALHEAGIPENDPAYQRAVSFLTLLQNRSESNPADWASDDGGFVYTPGGSGEYESRAGEYETPDGQRRLRSYGSMTYTGLKSMIYAGLSKDDPRVQAAFAWLENNWTLDANAGMAEGDPELAEKGLYYNYLVLATALDVYDQPILDTPDGPVDWRIALIEKLEELQNDDGSWVGMAEWRENDPTMVTAYTVIALNYARKDLAEHPAE